MSFWPFWLSGGALALIALGHWILLRRPLAVSGRYTALVDALRFRRDEAPPGPIDQAALLAALRAETELAFGPGAFDGDCALPEPVTETAPSATVAAAAPPQSTLAHTQFMLALGLGGAASSVLASDWSLSFGLRSHDFARLSAALGVPGPVLLLVGGMLVGFGTRMAGGCTSGHGLCGVSRVQSGSLLATAAFFGAGVALSFALGRLL
jgi:uncharacterized membrane protein YedE/YeeE